MTTETFAAKAGRTAGRAVRGAIWLQAQIDWAEVGQIVWHGLIALAVATYVAGELSGRWLHRLNGLLAAWWASRLATPPVAAGSAPEAPAALPVVVPVLHPLAVLASELEAMTCRQLKTLTGARRKLAKRELVALAIALA